MAHREARAGTARTDAIVLAVVVVVMTVAFLAVTVTADAASRRSASTPSSGLPPAVRADPPPGPPPAAVDTDPAVITAPCAPAARACVQLSTQHVWLVEDGRVVRDGFISSGTTDMATPTGMFAVQYKVADYRSRAYDTPMPYSVFFDRNGDALHGGDLGVQSRGCVHLEDADALAFYDALDVGDPVQILP